MKKRILSLCICLILTVSCFLTSCELDYETIDLGEIGSAIRSEVSTQKDDETETDGSHGNGNNNVPERDEDKKPPIEFPDIGEDIELPVGDFNNTEIVVLTDIGVASRFPLFSNGGEYYINNLVWQRQEAVEGLLNVSIYNRICDMGDSNRFLNHTRSILLSGDELDMIEGHSQAMLVLATEGLLCDLDRLDVMNTEAPYWSENAVRDLATSNGSLFFIDGAISLGNMLKSEVMFFNEDLADNYGLPSVYELVLDGRWTVEEFKRMAYSVATNVDGDEVFNIAIDTFGYVTHERYLAAFILYHTGENSVVYDGDKNSLVMNWNSPKMMNAYDNVMSLVESTAGYCGELENKKQVNDAFLQGRALFCTDVLDNRAYLSSNGEMNVGVAPLPKADLDAKNYCTPIYQSAYLYGISSVSAKAKETAIVMDAMSAYGYAILETFAIKESSSADEAESMKLIYSTLNYDLAYLGNMGTSSILSRLMNGGTLASAVADYLPSVLNERILWDQKASFSVGK